jgi:hypothetical protein
VKTGTGLYTVTFDRVITNCTYTVNVTSNFLRTTAALSFSPNVVTVFIANSGSLAQTDEAFHLKVEC